MSIFRPFPQFGLNFIHSSLDGGDRRETILRVDTFRAQILEITMSDVNGDELHPMIVHVSVAAYGTQRIHVL
jgi:hypothetical protein